MSSQSPTSSELHLAIIRQHYRADGGAERFIARALSGLKNAGAAVQTSIIARDWQAQDSSEFLICNPDYRGRVARESSFADAARKIVDSHQFDLVQSHERIPHCDIFRAGDGVHATWLEQKQRIANPLSNWFLKHSRFHQYQLAAEKALYASKQLKTVICNSKMVLEDIASRFKLERSKLTLIYNGLDLNEFNPEVKRHRKIQREKFNVKAQDFVLIFIGSGFERKGLKQSIQALAKAPKHCKLLVVGQDKNLKFYQALAQKLAPERVIFTGLSKDVKPLLGMSDTLFLPSLYDPFPNAISEALACGVPVITSLQTGGAELVINNNSGFASDALDIKRLNNAILELCEDKFIERRNDEAHRIGQTFDLEQSTQKLIKLYQQLSPLNSTLSH